MIYGTQKLSLVDYPGKPSFVLFLGGCNFRCPFCHNKGIVEKEFPVIPLEDVLKQLEERIHFIDAIVVTGGEPTIYGDRLIDLLKTLKATGLKIKLDTNGTHPDLLEKIFNQKLVDYVAMDIKGTWDKYYQISGVKVPLQKVKKSIYLLEESGISYEFRTTVCKEFHNKEEIEEIKTYFKDPSRYYLQPYQYSEQQIEDVHYTPYDTKELEELHSELLLSVKA